MDYTSLLSVVGTALGFLLIGWKMFSDISCKIEKQIKELKGEVKIDFDTIWRRFDERKAFVDAKCSKHHKEISDIYLRKEVYTANHSHLQEVLETQFKSYIRVMDEKMANITKLIENMTPKNGG